MEDNTKFITFYSFKGGVGRTSALVNAAVLRALEGDHVVILDLDFEAPGIDSYLKTSFKDYVSNKPGLLEYFNDGIYGNVIPPLIDMAQSIKIPQNKKGGKLWAIHSGNIKSSTYSSTLEKFDWNDIFKNHQGELFLKNFKQQIINEFDRPDYVFIDSRTGITEIGGVCTRYLADQVVILASLNDQNIQGASSVYKEITKNKEDSILVASNIPVGLPTGPDQLLTKRLSSFEEKFDKKPDVFILYYPALSIHEYIPVLNETEELQSLKDVDPLYQSYKKLSEKIESQNSNSRMKTMRDLFEKLPGGIRASDEEKIEKVKNFYSNRPLTKLFFNLQKLFSPKNFENYPENWDEDLYKRVKQDVENINQDFCSRIFRYLGWKIQRVLSDSIKNKKIDMKENLESYLVDNKDKAELEVILLSDIRNNKFDWATQYLERELKTQKDPIKRVPVLFNLATVYKRLGKSGESKALYEELIQTIKDIAESPENGKVLKFKKDMKDINFLFCHGIAYNEIGNPKGANYCIKLALEKVDNQLSAKPKGRKTELREKEVFSPLDYEHHTLEEMRKQLRQYLTSINIT